MSEFNLCQVDCRFGVVKAFEQLLKSFQMLLTRGGVDYDVINVCTTPLDATDDLVD